MYIYIECVDLKFFSSYSHVRCSFSLASIYIVCFTTKKILKSVQKKKPYTQTHTHARTHLVHNFSSLSLCLSCNLSQYHSHSVARQCFCLNDIYTNTLNAAWESTRYMYIYICVHTDATHSHRLKRTHTHSIVQPTIMCAYIRVFICCMCMVYMNGMAW